MYPAGAFFSSSLPPPLFPVETAVAATAAVAASLPPLFPPSPGCAPITSSPPFLPPLYDAMAAANFGKIQIGIYVEIKRSDGERGGGEAVEEESVG